MIMQTCIPFEAALIPEPQGSSLKNFMKVEIQNTDFHGSERSGEHFQPWHSGRPTHAAISGGSGPLTGVRWTPLGVRGLLPAHPSPVSCLAGVPNLSWEITDSAGGLLLASGGQFLETSLLLS